MKVNTNFSSRCAIPNKGRSMGDFGEMGFSFSDLTKGVTQSIEQSISQTVQKVVPQEVYIELSQTIKDAQPDLKAAVQGETGALTDSIMAKVMSKVTGDTAQIAAAEKVGADVGAAYSLMKQGKVGEAFLKNKTGAVIITSVLATFGIFGFIVIRGIVRN